MSKRIWIGLAAMLFAAAAAFGFARSALAAQQGKLAESKLRYEAQEEAYVERARRVLEEAGLDEETEEELSREIEQQKRFFLEQHGMEE